MLACSYVVTKGINKNYRTILCCGCSIHTTEETYFNPIGTNFKLRAVHSVGEVKMAAHARNYLSNVLALCGVFPGERATVMRGTFDAVSEEDGGLLLYQF